MISTSPSVDDSLVGIEAILNTTAPYVATTLIEESQIILEQTDLRKQAIYKVAYKGYCYLFFMLLIPAGAMIVLNVFVTVRVRRAYKWRKAMSGREEKERRCTIMAVLVVVTFLVFNSLAFANNMIEIFASASTPAPGEEEPIPAAKSTPYLLSVSIGNVLIALNSATNFIIYCALGGRFRTVFCKIFCMERCLSSSSSTNRYAVTGMRDRSYHSVAVRYGPQGKVDRTSCHSRQQNGAGSDHFLSAKQPKHNRYLTASFDDLATTSNYSHDGHRKSCDSTTSGMSHRYV